MDLKYRKPLVTIIALNYNQEKYLIETLNSIASQEYDNIELIITDDCSIDKSVNLVREWLKLEKRKLSTKLVLNTTNIGICATLNKALNESNGEYISIVACDDIITKNKISKQVSALNATKDSVACVYSDAEVIDENGKIISNSWISHRRPQRLSGNIFEEILEHNHVLLQSSLIKVDHLKDVGGFDQELSFEDLDINLRLAKNYEYIYTDMISCKYRKHSNGTSESLYSTHLNSYITALIKHTGDNNRQNLLIKKKISQRIRNSYFLSQKRIQLSKKNLEYLDENSITYRTPNKTLYHLVKRTYKPLSKLKKYFLTNRRNISIFDKN